MTFLYQFIKCRAIPEVNVPNCLSGYVVDSSEVFLYRKVDSAGSKSDVFCEKYINLTNSCEKLCHVFYLSLILIKPISYRLGHANLRCMYSTGLSTHRNLSSICTFNLIFSSVIINSINLCAHHKLSELKVLYWLIYTEIRLDISGSLGKLICKQHEFLANAAYFTSALFQYACYVIVLEFI